MPNPSKDDVLVVIELFKIFPQEYENWFMGSFEACKTWKELLKFCSLLLL